MKAHVTAYVNVPMSAPMNAPNSPMTETWTASWAIRNIIAELLMPPGIWIMLGLGGLIFFRHKQRLKNLTLGIALVMIWVTSTSVFSHWLVNITEPFMQWPKPLNFQTLCQSKGCEEWVKGKKSAIVILGGGVRRGAMDTPQYLNQDVTPEAMERIRMGVRLSKLTKIPLLVTGGSPNRTKESDRAEGRVMAQVIEEEFGLPVRWIEDRSATTQENAQFSAKLLEKDQIDQVYLVTQYWHMPRAKRIFEKEHLKVIAVPTGFHHEMNMTPLDFLPRDLLQTRFVWHEILGSLWYRLRFG